MLLQEAVQQDDRVVDREGQLKDHRHGVRDEGDLPKQEVRAEVQHRGVGEGGYLEHLLRRFGHHRAGPRGVEDVGAVVGGDYIRDAVYKRPLLADGGGEVKLRHGV